MTVYCWTWSAPHVRRCPIIYSWIQEIHTIICVRHFRSMDLVLILLAIWPAVCWSLPAESKTGRQQPAVESILIVDPHRKIYSNCNLLPKRAIKGTANPACKQGERKKRKWPHKSMFPSPRFACILINGIYFSHNDLFSDPLDACALRDRLCVCVCGMEIFGKAHLNRFVGKW